MSLEDKNRPPGESPKSSGCCSTPLIVLSVFAVLVVVIAAVGAGVGVALSDDGDNDNLNLNDDPVIDFDDAEFNLFEFFAICSQLEGQGAIAQDDDYYDGDATVIGIETCFAGHSISCDGFIPENPNGFHCPTLVLGDCQCGEGVINLLFSETTQFPCDVNLEGEAFDYISDYFDDFGECTELGDEFDAAELLALADIDEFTAGDLDGSLDILNTLFEQCIGQQDAFNEQDIGDEDIEVIFNSCINGNMRFSCDSFGYSFFIEACNFPPGDQFGDDEIGGIEAINFDEAEFNLFEFLSICNNLESTGLFIQDDDYYDDVGFLNGIQTCYNGLELSCLPLLFDAELTGFDSFGFHCPTTFAGDCGCEEGSINLRTSLFDTFPCEINTGEDIEDYIENYYQNTGECNALNNEFDANDLLDADFANDLADNDVDAALAIFNDVLGQCMSTQNRLVEVNSTFTGERFDSCISSNLRFTCDELGYTLTAEACDNPPGEIFNEGGNYYYSNVKKAHSTSRIFG